VIKKQNRAYIERYALALLVFNKEVWMKYYSLLSDKMFKLEPLQLIFKFLKTHSGTLTYKMLSHELRQRESSIGSAAIIRCQTAYLKIKKLKYDLRESEYIFKTLVKYTATEETFAWMKIYIEAVEAGEVERAEQLKMRHFLHSSINELGIDSGEIIKSFKERKDILLDKVAHPEKYKLCKSGVKALDKVIGGFSKGEFILLAGHTAKGKSTLALNIAFKNQIMGKKILYFINEMPRYQVETKYDSIVTKIPYSSFKFAKLDKKQMIVWERKIRNLHKFGGEFHVISVPENCTTNLIREMVKMHEGVDLVIVDSLLYMDATSRGFSEQGDLGGITKELKGIAVRFGIPILAITQLNAESLEKEKLDYSDIGYSRRMSHIADMIIGIPNAQDDDDNGFNVQLVKHRDGKRDIFFKIYIDWSTGRVQNEPLDSGNNQDYPSSFEN